MIFSSEAHMKKCHGTLIKLLFICIFRMLLLISHNTRQNYTTIWHFVQITSPLVSSSAVLLQPLVTYREKNLLEPFFFFFVGRKNCLYLLKVCGWDLWIKLTKDRLTREKAYILVNNGTKNWGGGRETQMAKLIRANLIDILNVTSPGAKTTQKRNPKRSSRLGSLYTILTKGDKLWSKKAKEKVWMF